MAEAPEGPLAEKVEWLIAHMWPSDAPSPETNQDVAEAITAATGTEISSTGIWKIRTGRGGNPTLKTLGALCSFFGVPLGYFGEDEDAHAKGDVVTLLSLLRVKGVSRATLRKLAELPPESRQMVTDMIDSADRIEKQRGRE